MPNPMPSPSPNPVLQADLDKAIPALDAAQKALELLNKKDMAEVKAYAKPPPAVETVMEAVMVLRKQEPTWAEAKKQLGDPNFLMQLVQYDKELLTDSVLNKVNKYTREKSFDPEVTLTPTRTLTLTLSLSLTPTLTLTLTLTRTLTLTLTLTQGAPVGVALQQRGRSALGVCAPPLRRLPRPRRRGGAHAPRRVQ